MNTSSPDRAIELPQLRLEGHAVAQFSKSGRLLFVTDQKKLGAVLRLTNGGNYVKVCDIGEAPDVATDVVILEGAVDMFIVSGVPYESDFGTAGFLRAYSGAKSELVCSRDIAGMSPLRLELINDSRIAIGYSNGIVEVVSIATLMPTDTLKERQFDAPVTDLAWSSDKSLLAVATFDERITITRLDDRHYKDLVFPTRPGCRRIAFSPRNPGLIAAKCADDVMIIDTTTGRHVLLEQFSDGIAAWAADGTLVGWKNGRIVTYHEGIPSRRPIP